MKKTNFENAFKQSNIDFSTIQKNFQAKTIYKTDYVPKVIEE